jgi:hypothetical protein
MKPIIEKVCEYDYFSDKEYVNERLLFYPESQIFRIVGYNWMDNGTETPIRDEYAATVNRDFVEEAWLKDKPQQAVQYKKFLKKYFGH